MNGVIFAFTFIGVLWASSILAQLAKNAAYRMVGKAPMPIEWYYVRLPKPKRRTKRWKDEGFDLRKF
ncbi:hypothetical protein H0274_01750 [Altererythrobacter sp. CC-YST694]|uniref:hypothetical protein n=1 Tax=Altererythrobacter sp. CC-YST694 TaxID=2755038 RepID=UPI001D03083B|nr:hypothetical protein [Altererythrobacter sp. CC-YST694]MCB5423969.1 hypothetical protein [Altererythrobacter sp. CC-YST694]